MAIPKGEKGFPRFPESTGTNQKKRARRGLLGRPRKRASIMSRNRVVNMFMRLDDGAHEPEGVSADAFVDLEDFLVEG